MNMSKRYGSVLLFCLGLQACSGGADTQPNPPPVADTVAPTVPGAPAVTAMSSTRIDLTWTGSTDAVGVSGYRIFRNGSSTPFATAATTTYSDTSVVASTAYTYTVRAFDAAGNESAASGAGGATTPAAPVADTTPPTVPGTPTATAISSTRIDLTWAASTDAVGVSGYRIFRNGSATALATATATNYSDTTVVASTAYTYTVRAFDAAGNESALSSAGGATTPAGPVVDTTPPTVPGTPAATPISSTRIDLSWAASTDNVGVSGYRIFRNGSATALATAATTAYSDTNVVASTAYTYTLRAFDAAGNESIASAAGGATTPAAPPSGQGGLDTRPSNTTCLAWDQPNTGSTISLSRFTNLTFNMPVKMLQSPNSSQHWYVLQQLGTVRRFTGTNPSSATTVLDITGRVFNVADTEAGLLGMAFHPNFPTDTRVFLYYIDRQHRSVSASRRSPPRSMATAPRRSIRRPSRIC